MNHESWNRPQIRKKLRKQRQIYVPPNIEWAKLPGQLHQNFKYLIRLGDNYCPTRLAVVLRLLQLS